MGSVASVLDAYGVPARGAKLGAACTNRTPSYAKEANHARLIANALEVQAGLTAILEVCYPKKYQSNAGTWSHRAVDVWAQGARARWPRRTSR